MAEYEYIKYIIRNKEPLRIADDSTSQSGQTVTLRYIPGTTMRGYIINKMAASSDFEQLKEETHSRDKRQSVISELLLRTMLMKAPIIFNPFLSTQYNFRGNSISRSLH